MKRLFVLSLFLFSVTLFAQSTIDFETVGQDFVWTIFSNGPQQDTTDYAVVTNPAASGINTSSKVGKYVVRANGDPWSGIFTDSYGNFVLTADNCMPTVMVYKDVISNFNLKLEFVEPGTHDVNVPNTLTNQWEKLTFDYTADIGKTVKRITIIPDFPATRTAGSMNYFDNIEFDPTTAPARVQIIHNSADIAAGAVDIYVNGTLALDDFAFRAATPFIDLPSAVTLNIGVAAGNSTSVTDTIKNFQVVLAKGEKYVVFANGLLTGGYSANPDGRNTDFTLFVKPMAQETAVGSGVDFFVLHGATDAPAVDVQVKELGGATIVDNAFYGDITGYLNAPAQNLTLDLYLADGTTYVASFIAPLSGLDGGSAVVFASGFLDPANNQNGKAFGLFAALANGTVVQFLPPPSPGATVNFETNGNDWNWILFDGTKANFDVVANPSKVGNTTDSCAMLQITDVTADPWLGVFSPDFPDFTFDANNCFVRIWVYKDHISNVGLKIEPARTTDYNIPNTVINQWEEIVFDYSAYIGKEAKTLVVIPDFAPGPPRTYTSTSYFDEVSFGDVIPVELTSFTASVVGNSFQLRWATATETNNQGFEIQRGINNRDLVTVGFVKGNGTTTETQSYTYVDNTELNGTVYYRLKQLDLNGKYEYSKVVEVTRVVSYGLSQNYPNPFNPTTAITYSIPENSFVTLKVYDVLGSEVADLVNGVVEAGVHKVNFNAFNLNSGVYFYTIKAGNFSETKKLMLMK